MALQPGARIGGFEILDALGAGGMGEVYRARDAKLARDVALKVLPAEFALDADRLARFTREAQVLASLNHQNIAGIYGFEQGPAEAGHDVHALVLEFVDGPTLADRIAQGPVPVDEALPIARQIAEALEAAHEQGIVHRDLKPANIKVRPDGTVKVLDFGLAKLAQAPGPGPQASAGGLTLSPTITTPAMTQVGMILGTAAYMSPEQAKGREADKRSDIWSFGCVLFEMLTGKRVFSGEDVSDTLAAVLRADPDWSALPASTPGAVRVLLRRCLEKDRKRRAADAVYARLEIDEACGNPALPPPTDAKRSIARSAVPVAIGIVLAVATTSGLWWMLRPSSPSPLVTRFAITLPEGQAFTGIGRHVIDVSRDGTQLVYAANRRLYRKTLGELEAIPVAGSENPTGVTSPAFSPDGRWIAFIGVAPGGSAIQRVPSGGGSPQIVASIGALAFGLSWSNEGILFGGGQRGILRVSPNGGVPEEVVTVKPGQAAVNPHMLPGGEAVLYTRRGVNFTSDDAEIVVHSLKSGKDAIVVKNGMDARYVDTGHLLYVIGGVVYAVAFDPKQMVTTGDAVQVVNGVARTGTGGVLGGGAQFSVSDNGALAYLPGPAVGTQAQFDLALIDRTGRIERLMLPPAEYETPRVSPDGKRVAVSASDRSKGPVILIYDLSGATSPQPLTFGGRNRFPTWSGNGRQVAFQSDREGDLAVFVQRVDGNGQAERLTKPAQGISHVPDSWSPDGEHLLYSETKGTEFSSWIVSLKDKQVSPFGDIHSLLPTNAVFSPSGKWVAYQSGRPGDNAVWVQPFPPTGTKYLVSNGSAAHHPTWSRSGKEIIYLPAQSNAVVASVNTQPSFSVGKATVELPAKGQEGGPASIRTYDVMPDGRLLAVVNADPRPSGAPDIPQIRVVLNWFEELKQKLPR